MRKNFILLVTMMSFISAIEAQVKGNTLGVRGGGGGELSFENAVGASNRLEWDLGLNNWDKNDNHSGFQLTGVYQWVYSLSQIAPGFNWYGGLGGTLGAYHSNFGLGLVGQLGLEYNFTVPLQISLDWRPTLFNTYYTDYGSSGFAIRYRF
jgi:hypothetical protein